MEAIYAVYAWTISMLSMHGRYLCYFGLALSGIASPPIRLSDVLNLKKLKGDKVSS